jgi:hypothetical protein
MVKKLIPSFLCFLLLAAPRYDASAQTTPSAASVLQPDTTVLGSLPDSFTFKKKITYLKDASPADDPPNRTEGQKATMALYKKLMKGHLGKLVELDSTQTAKVRKDILHMSDGMVQENWRYDAIRFHTESLYPDYVGISPAQQGNRVIADAPDFEELSWINEKTFTRTEAKNGVEYDVHCLADKTAWLDQNTHLPIAFESAEMKVAYSYGPPPAAPLQLPPKMQKRLTEIQHAWSGAPDPQP